MRIQEKTHLEQTGGLPPTWPQNNQANSLRKMLRIDNSPVEDNSKHEEMDTINYHTFLAGNTTISSKAISCMMHSIAQAK
jgi:hypothetical protein